MVPDAANDKKKVADNSQVITWKTKVNDYISKMYFAYYDVGSHEEISSSLYATYNDVNETSTAYITDLGYTFYLTRNSTEELEGIGSDPLKYITGTLTVTFPENVIIPEDSSPFLEEISSISSALRYEITSVIVNDANQIIINFESWRLTRKLNISFRHFFELKNIPEENEDITINADLEIQEHFGFSNIQIDTANASKKFKIKSGNAELTKEVESDSSKLNEANVYTLKEYNSGMTDYKELSQVYDTLATYTYLNSSDISELFSNDKDNKWLTITVTNVDICKVPEVKSVIATDGSQTATISVNNTNVCEAYDSHIPIKYGGDDSVLDTSATVVFSWNDNPDKPILITCGETAVNCAIDANEIQSVLDSMGFVVTSNTTYALTWQLNKNGNVFVLHPGQSFVFSIPYHTKNSFMAIGGDNCTQVIDREINGSTRDNYENTAFNQLSDGATIKSNEVKCYVENDISINISGQSNNENLTAAPADQEIINYTIKINHTGDGIYDLLPVIDYISGSQILLAEVELNKNSTWSNSCEIVEIDGIKYYKLYSGEYSGVWLNGNYADTVSVKKTNEGLATFVKWYFTNMTGKTTKTLNTKTLVDTNLSENFQYKIYNKCWLNDHETHRLYDYIGTLIGIDGKFVKEIVSAEDVNAALDSKEVGKSYSLVNPGDTVYYRIAITNTSNKDNKITGRDIVDTLPPCIEDTFEWHYAAKDDFSAGSVHVIKYEGCKNGSLSINDVTHPYEKKQKLRWDWSSSTIIPANGTMYIYIRLTFPDGALFDTYAAYCGDTTLTNTFSLFENTSSVTHNLALQCEAYIQKGVVKQITDAHGYINGRRADPYSGVIYGLNTAIKNLKYYSVGSKVQYYVCIYNGGKSKLYLQDIQDILPDGYTYIGVTSEIYPYFANESESNPCNDGASLYLKSVKLSVTESDYKINKSNATFYVVDTLNSDQSKVTFTLTTKSSSHKDSEGCFLQSGESLVFFYTCSIDNDGPVANTATNRIAMPYYNYADTDISVTDGVSATITDSSSTPNDGSCELWNNETAYAAGFTGGEGDTQWLVSDVTQTRGEIKPGIKKVLSSTTLESGAVNNDPVSANPADILNWTITAYNDGDSILSDYVITDTMQAPYLLTGDITFKVNDSSEIIRVNTDDISNGIVSVSWYKKKPTFSNNKDYVSTSTTWRTEKLSVNGELLVLDDFVIDIVNKKTSDVYFQITQDEETGDYSWSIRFPDTATSILPGQTFSVDYSAKRTNNVMENKVYVNTCYITPIDGQLWDGTTNHGNITTLGIKGQQAEDLLSVRNSAPVTVAYGYATTSLKSVTEKSNPDNTTTCKSDTNYIVLDNADNPFTYTLEIDNTDKNAMKKLVIIDSLPEVGDHSVFQTDDLRFSEFAVAIADDPQLSVTVTAKDGTVTTLDANQYTADYNSEVNREFTDNDWNGKASGDWTSDSSTARAIRIIINDSSLIPASSVVEVSFLCKVQGDAKPGTIAWNSFGYRYQLSGGGYSMDAAPLKVGVKVPTIPSIQKVLETVNGDPAPLTEDTTYEFLIYTGSNLGLTGEELQRALIADPNSDRKIASVTLTVPAGKSKSDLVYLNTLQWHKCSYIQLNSLDWVESLQWTDLDLTDGMTFNVVEITDDLPSGVSFGSINKNVKNGTCSLTYDRKKSAAFTAVNLCDSWEYTLIKTNAGTQTQRLEGAYFALYSPNSADAMTDTVYDKLTTKYGLTEAPEKTLTSNDKAYYFAKVLSTDSNGTLVWNSLLREDYLYKEIKAPDGYVLDSSVHSFAKTDEKLTATITNMPNLLPLPVMGGTGVGKFLMIGLAAVGTAIVLKIIQRKRKQRRNDILSLK